MSRVGVMSKGYFFRRVIPCVVLVVLAATACSSNKHRDIGPPPSTRTTRQIKADGTYSKGKADATAYLQQQLNVPNNTLVVFPLGATYRIVGTITIRSKQNVTIDGNGATIASGGNRAATAR